jgi:hypothetical protein
MKATLVNAARDNKVLTYFANGYYFINDKNRMTGLIVKNGKLIERTTGSNYVRYCMNFIESVKN